MAASSAYVRQGISDSSCSALIKSLNEIIEKIEQVVRQQEAQREAYFRGTYSLAMRELERQELMIKTNIEVEQRKVNLHDPSRFPSVTARGGIGALHIGTNAIIYGEAMQRLTQAKTRLNHILQQKSLYENNLASMNAAINTNKQQLDSFRLKHKIISETEQDIDEITKMGSIRVDIFNLIQQFNHQLLEGALNVSQYYYEVANLFFINQSLAAAQRNYFNAIRAGIKSSAAYQNLASCYNINGEKIRANETFQLGIARYPSASMIADYAHFLWQEQDIPAALTHIDACLSLPDIESVYYGPMEKAVTEPHLVDIAINSPNGYIQLSPHGLVRYLQVLCHRATAGAQGTATLDSLAALEQYVLPRHTQMTAHSEPPSSEMKSQMVALLKALAVAHRICGHEENARHYEQQANNLLDLHPPLLAVEEHVPQLSADIPAGTGDGPVSSALPSTSSSQPIAETQTLSNYGLLTLMPGPAHAHDTPACEQPRNTPDPSSPSP